MSFYNTGNPVPSIDPRDLDDNAKILDDFVNGTVDTYLDRLGVERRTLFSIEHDADSALLRSDLANAIDLMKGAALIGVPGTGQNLKQILEARLFPHVRPGFVTTSSQGIVSVDYTDDKRAELQALLDEFDDVEIDTQIAINDTLTMSKTRAVLSCATGGKLLAGPGMAQKTMINVTGHYAMLSRMNMDNPAMLKATTGGRQTAIKIQADHVTVRDCTFQHMLHSVMTESTGEWYMPVYFNNVALDCLGVGAGASDDGSTSFGEDRGDAFLIWGATGVMLHNFAFCMPGQDARIAFHCESLGNDFHTRPNNAARDGFDYWMINNYAFGNFRRHFAFEAVDRGLMSGNISGGGATWWVIALTGGNDCLATDMEILYDRPSTNTAGAAWSPARAAIGHGHNGSNNTLRNIKVRFSADAVGAGLTSLVTNLTALGSTLDNISILKPAGQTGIGFVLDKLPDVKSNNCSVANATTGITTFGPQDNWIRGFHATDITGSAISLSGGGAGQHARVEGGRFERVGVGVDANNLTTVSMRGVQAKTVTTADFRQFGTTGAITIEGNHNEDGNGRLSGMNSPFTLTQERYIVNNPGYTYDMRHQIVCFTDATSAINTKGKFAGRTLIRSSDGAVMIANGSTPTSTWTAIVGTTVSTVTPA